MPAENDSPSVSSRIILQKVQEALLWMMILVKMIHTLWFRWTFINNWGLDRRYIFLCERMSNKIVCEIRSWILEWKFVR